MHSSVVTAAYASVLVALLGCSSTADRVADAVAAVNTSNCQRLANCCRLFETRNNYEGPIDKDALVKFLKEPRVERNLRFMGIDQSDVEDIFVSKRDGQELIVRYGLRGGPMGPYHPVVFEQTGVDGVRLVAYTSSKVIEVSDAEQYERLLEGKTKAEIVDTSVDL